MAYNPKYCSPSVVPQFIPCFTRKQVLKKLVVFSFQKTTAKPKLKTKHGFLFHCSLVNYKGKTFFSGSTWGEFAKVYKFVVGMKLHFDISTHGPIIKVDLDNDPIVHPCECFETHVPCLCVDLQLIVSLK